MRTAILLLLAAVPAAWAQDSGPGRTPIGVKVRPPMRHRTWGWQFI